MAERTKPCGQWGKPGTWSREHEPGGDDAKVLSDAAMRGVVDKYLRVMVLRVDGMMVRGAESPASG